MLGSGIEVMIFEVQAKPAHQKIITNLGLPNAESECCLEMVWL